MRTALREKLKKIVQRYHDLEQMMNDPAVFDDHQHVIKLSQEHAALKPIATCVQQYEANECALAAVQELLAQETDVELRALAVEEWDQLKEHHAALNEQLKALLMTQDPNDGRDIFLEIRSGSGGQEASLFAGDLFRMYARFAELKGWHIEMVSVHESEQGGYKEVIAKISGERVYSQLKFESGTHRVQRVPTTESQGRLHTSACTVAVLPEGDQIDTIHIDPAELRIDTFRSSGAGGQHVNKTDSAIRITHKPTGLVVECQDQRSQHKNKAQALSLLQARLIDQERTKQRDEQALNRRELIGSGDRSQRIRTYNFPQGRITDHRIALTLYQLPSILAGDLYLLIEPLAREFQAQQIADDQH